MKLFKKNAAPLLHLAGLDVNLVKASILPNKFLSIDPLVNDDDLIHHIYDNI